MRRTFECETITLSAVLTGEETELATLVEIDGEAHWLPFSQIHIGEEDRFGGTLIVLPEWLAKREGIV